MALKAAGSVTVHSVERFHHNEPDMNAASVRGHKNILTSIYFVSMYILHLINFFLQCRSVSIVLLKPV